MELVICFLICLFSTTIGAISGIGGGVIIKPVFDLFSGIPTGVISFLSGCTVLSMTLVSLLRSRGSETKIELKRGTLLAVGGAAGGILGKMIFDTVKAAANNDSFVGLVQNAIMAALTLAVGLYVLRKDKIRTRNIQNPVSCILIGLFLGAAGAFLGIGGGPINLVILYYFFSLDTKNAALTSLYIIFFSQGASLISTFCTGKIPKFSIAILLFMIAGGILGGFAGRFFSVKLTSKNIDRLFIGVLLIITGISIYNVIHFAGMSIPA